MYTLENWRGLSAILFAEVAFFVLLAIVPFVDRNPERLWRRRPIAMALALLFVLILIALTILMKLTKAKSHLGM